MEYGKNTFRDRGVSFVLDAAGCVVSIRGYSSTYQRLELKSTKAGTPLRAQSFSEAAQSLGLKDSVALASQLRAQGMTVIDAVDATSEPTLTSSLLGIWRSRKQSPGRA